MHGGSYTVPYRTIPVSLGNFHARVKRSTFENPLRWSSASTLKPSAAGHLACRIDGCWPGGLAVASIKAAFEEPPFFIMTSNLMLKCVVVYSELFFSRISLKHLHEIWVGNGWYHIIRPLFSEVRFNNPFVDICP